MSPHGGDRSILTAVAAVPVELEVELELVGPTQEVAVTELLGFDCFLGWQEAADYAMLALHWEPEL